MYDAKNSQIKFYDDTINYVSFGYGNKNSSSEKLNSTSKV